MEDRAVTLHKHPRPPVRAKRPTESAPRDRTPRGAPAAVIARRPAERPASRNRTLRGAPALLIGITPRSRSGPRSGRGPRKP
jgi:hypothetical protein